MAKFNEDQGPVQADYTSDSKGYRPNTAFSDLFKNATDIGMDAVKVADRENIIQIQKKVNQGIDSINNEWGISDENVKTPSDVVKYSEKLANVRKAYMNGTLTDSSYQFKIDAMTRQIRAQYPGYRDEIDSVVNKTLGQSTANDLRKSLMNLWTTEASKLDDDDKRYAIEVSQAREKAALPADWDIRNASGNPYSKGETRVFIAQRYQQDADMDRTLKSLQVLDKQSEAGKKAAYDAASKEISVYAQRAAEGVLSVGDKTLPQLRASINAGLKVTLTDAQKRELNAGVNQWKTETSAKMDQVLNRPEYSTLTADQRKDLKSRMTDQIDAMADAYTNGQYGLLNYSKTLNDTGVQDRLRNIRELNPDLDTISAVKELSNGSAVFDSLLLNNPEMRSKADNAIASILTYKVFTGDTTADKAFADTKNQTGQAVSPEVQKQTVTNALKVITNKDAGLDVVTNAAHFLFSEENQAFLGHYDTKSQDLLMNTMVSPRITERMWELGQSDPKIWENYRNWTLNSFGALFGQEINTMVQNNQAGDNLIIQQNPKTGLFEAVPNPAAMERGRITPGLQKIYNAWADSQTGKAVQRVNQYLQKLRPIIEKEGGDSNEAMMALFQRYGIDKQENTGSLFYRLYSALGANAKASLDIKKSGEYYSSVTKRIPEELNGIDLSTEGPAAVSSTLKDFIAKAEGGKSYNTRYGGRDDIELSHYNVGDVIEMGHMFGKRTGSSAMGKYQFMEKTLRDLVAKGIVKEDEPFTPALQEKMADYLLAQATNGKTDKVSRAKAIAGVWAGLPSGPEGNSAYEGIAGNSATVSWEDFMSAL